MRNNKRQIEWEKIGRFALKGFLVILLYGNLNFDAVGGGDFVYF